VVWLTACLTSGSHTPWMNPPVHDLKLSISKDGSISFEVRAKPNAKRSAIAGVREGALEVRVAAPPVDGAANEELVAVLASALGIPRRDVQLVHGTTSRAKRVQVNGLGVEEIRTRLRAWAS
jgi:uncharacterized protein